MYPASHNYDMIEYINVYPISLKDLPHITAKN